jgi:hypothetical protein
MTIEVKEIIVRTTVYEGNKSTPFDHFSYKKLKSDILRELRKELRKNEKRRKER